MMKGLTKTFEQVKRSRPKTFRKFARSIALDMLSQIKLPNSKKVFEKPRVQFLLIHHVFDDEVENFDNLLNVLVKNHTFISYSEAVDKVLSNEIDKPYISISSDDGFKNNLKAAEILEKYGAKGCFFINPDSIGLENFSKIKTFCKEKLDFCPTEFLDWNDVNSLLKKGHEIGSHTIGHINISETSISEVEQNINQSYQILSEKCGKVLHFAYPYGRFFHFNRQAYKSVFKAGFMSCASAERGCHFPLRVKPKFSELLIRRDQVHCNWNINHSLYFILNSAEKSPLKTNLNPYK